VRKAGITSRRRFLLFQFAG
ncbi:TPA: hypothetical protein ACG6UD_005413, partial [Escherichia coli]